jgi:hypothetical protein
MLVREVFVRADMLKNVEGSVSLPIFDAIEV